jgi:hypothetical protein
MAASFGGQRAEVERLADVALQAAAYEHTCRANLVARGRRAARKGLVIGAATAAGFVVVSVIARHWGDDDKDDRKRDDSRGIFERAGDYFLTVMRWGVTLGQFWRMAFAPTPAAAETLPDA